MSKNIIDLIYEHLVKLEKAVVGDDDDKFDLYSVGEEGNRKSIEQLESLRRLLYSIEIFKQRDAGLFTVIFLGHFSAAKSSTINWLLNLWNDPDKKRPTGNTATDTAITILSHQRKSFKYKISTNHVGQSVLVVPVDNYLLENAIFIDTPGSGEFAKDEENLKEYLFWSDLVVFCTNSNETLGHNDISVLLTKEKYLSSLPLIFAFTKVDNLFTDIIRSDKENRGCHGFKQDKYDKIVSAALEKLDKSIPGHKYIKNDFHPLLTYEDLQYGISELTDTIKIQEANRDPELIKAVMADRISAFTRRSKICKEYFQELGLYQLQTLKNHFSQLDSNRQRFNKLATFHNSPIFLELDLSRNRIMDAHRKLLSEFLLYSSISPSKICISDEDKKEWYESKLETAILSLKGTIVKEVNMLVSSQKNNYTNCEVSDFLKTIEKYLSKSCYLKVSFNLDRDARKISSFKENIINHYTKIKQKDRKYLPVVIKETNESIKNNFMEQIDSFNQNLNDFTEAAATMGDLDVFRISVARDQIKKMIKIVKDADIDTPDISSHLVDQNSIAKKSEAIFRKLKLELEGKITELKSFSIPSDTFSLDSNLFILKNDGLPAGYNSSNLSNKFLETQKMVREDKTKSTLNLIRLEKIYRFAKLGGIILPPILFFILLLTGNESIFTKLSSSSGILDSIIAAFIVNSAGIISVVSLIVCLLVIYSLSSIVKKIVDINREEKQKSFLSLLEDKVIEELIDNIKSKQLDLICNNIEHQCKDKIENINIAIEKLDNIRKDANSSLSICTRSLESLRDELLNSISTDTWSIFLSNIAEQAKDKRVEELYGYMNKLVLKAQQRVDAINQLEI